MHAGFQSVKPIMNKHYEDSKFYAGKLTKLMISNGFEQEKTSNVTCDTE